MRQSFEQTLFKDYDTPLILLDFMSKTCNPCKMLKAALGNIEKDYSNISIRVVDVKEDMELARAYDISNLPTLIIYKNKVEVERIERCEAESRLRKKLDDYLIG